MSLTGVAALIAAVSFAVLACCGVYLTVRLNRVLSDAATLVRETRDDQHVLLTRANAAVDRASAQLDRAQAVSASMDELGEGMAELAGQVGVTLLIPGGMHTPFFDGRPEQYKPPADAKLNQPEDVAQAVLFALSQPAGCEVREMVVCASTESSWP